ncbi:PA1571 family protein [Pseudomonas akapageensis]|uniref:PA1571 family protein n=1 Tax=Pseudomonas akapageensis TaxID=2609961 RepID=UPI0014072880|nr:PA1571 family protein [Pseudomonas akapageensis]
MGLQNSTSQEKKAPPQKAECGSIIDAQGREIPITRDMIQEACKQLENCVVKPAKKR